VSTTPFDVPPFSPPCKPVTFVWWSWHPLYPYWSQSCWAAATIEGAQEHLQKGRLSCYHNKLIRHDGITLTEVQDEPCREMEVWHEIKRRIDKENTPLTEPSVNVRNLTPGNGWTRHYGVWEDRNGNRVVPQTNIGQILMGRKGEEPFWIRDDEEPMRTALRRNGWNMKRAGLAVARLLLSKGDA